MSRAENFRTHAQKGVDETSPFVLVETSHSISSFDKNPSPTIWMNKTTHHRCNRNMLNTKLHEGIGSARDRGKRISGSRTGKLCRQSWWPSILTAPSQGLRFESLSKLGRVSVFIPVTFCVGKTVARD